VGALSAFFIFSGALRESNAAEQVRQAGFQPFGDLPDPMFTSFPMFTSETLRIPRSIPL